jgi:uncharacterized protein (TIGR00162 family)
MEKVLDFAEKFGVKELFTIGGIATGEAQKSPKALGAVTDKELVAKYQKFGIEFTAGDKIGYIVGAAGLLLGLGKERGMKGVCLLGETSGFPIVTDPKGAEIVLNSLTKILGIKIDMSKLEQKVKEMEQFIKKVEDLQKRALTEIAKDQPQAQQQKTREQTRYIG